MTFLRWMGGKREVVHQFKHLFPDINNCRGYIEPFIGGGSVFYYIKQNYDLDNKPVFLSDINRELMITYRIVRDKLDELIPLLEKHQELNNKEYYTDMKKIFPPGDGMTDVEKAAAFIYLSKSTFGSQWGVNSKGKLVSSYRGNEGENIYDDGTLKLCSRLLQGTNINNHSFELILKLNKGYLKDYFVYMDPPYYTVNVKNYAKDGFSLDTKMKIPFIFKELDKMGAKVMMSNADCPIMHKYFKDYRVEIIKTNRSKVQLDKITKEKMANEDDVTEVVVTNYEPPKGQLTIDDAWL